MIRQEEEKTTTADIKLELSSAILKLTESVVDVEIDGEQSTTASHAKSCDQHESDHFDPNNDPVLDNIVNNLEVEVAEIKKAKLAKIKEGKETVIKEGKEAEFRKGKEIKEAKVVGIKEGLVR